VRFLEESDEPLKAEKGDCKVALLRVHHGNNATEVIEALS